MHTSSLKSCDIALLRGDDVTRAEYEGDILVGSQASAHLHQCAGAHVVRDLGFRHEKGHVLLSLARKLS